MENYSKARTVEQPCACPFPDLSNSAPVVRVKDGSKIRNLMRFALSRMEGKAEKSGPGDSEGAGTGAEVQPCRQIMFTGAGPSVAKAISCVEILKRRVRGLHQHTRLMYHAVQDVWEPLVPEAGLDALTVSRNVPAVWVLLSKDPLDSTQPGYQAPGCFDTLWTQYAKEEAAGHKHGQRRKRGGGTGGSGRGKVSGRQAGPPKEARKTQ
ncbi:ribonuclease P protein subunit p25-like protein [Denticeps clupeoides]|uniref:DNA/RNA-binding protein Alba-like domain-containing protein n=1 Tax=Denticeps clupeoides TaxID=299321 RepID=A0AAY4A6C2_9TELE|nr:ribonuclease P protein subunit p25-like protein [Denticeps clupeoides]